MTIKTGATARLIQPEVRGRIVERRINPDTDEIELQLQWTDAAGETHARWFPESQLEEVAA